MAGRIVLLLGALLPACAAAVKVASSTVSLQRGASQSLKERPVMKVVRLLEDMKAELNKELEDDKAVYEQLACWCKAGDKDKAAAIDMALQLISQLESSLSEAAAKVMELKQQRKSTWDEIQADHKALTEATGLRHKEQAAFQGEEKDLLAASQACKQAVIVLSKHHPDLMQVQSIARTLQLARVQEMLLSSSDASMSRLRQDALKDFIEGAQKANSFLAVPGFQSYAPQSGQIFGILRQMAEQFEGSLSEAQKAEAQAVEEFAALRTAKQEEITAGDDKIVSLDSDLAALGEKAAEETKELEDVQGQMALDNEFLFNLRKKCSESDAEMAARTKSRLEEMAAVEDTIKILNSDEAFASMDKTVSSFVQVSSVTASEETSETVAKRNKVSTLLQKVAGSTGAPALALLAASAQLDTFEKVKVEIDKMVAELGKQQKDEVGHRDWCIKELNSNNRSMEEGYEKKESLETKKADLAKETQELTAKIAETDAAMVETQTQMKRAGEVREGENAEFQQTVVDQRLTQQILQKALGRMQQVYALYQSGDEGAPHIQTSGNATDPGNGPARFTKYDQHAGGSRVVSMIEEVVADSRRTEDEAMTSEEDGQTAYEELMKESNKALAKYLESKMNLSEAKAKAEGSLALTESDMKGNFQTLEGLNSVSGDLHKSCDFVIKNFDARQAARAAEIEGLVEAKAILSGAK
mmetsp:Transcript_35530/g.94110  ORF Transcript_35530/g.94110 Transcript_35530/m.94110 type:complete len:699 (-) Transcript_35530:90-2186(-)